MLQKERFNAKQSTAMGHQIRRSIERISSINMLITMTIHAKSSENKKSNHLKKPIFYAEVFYG